MMIIQHFVPALLLVCFSFLDGVAGMRHPTLKCSRRCHVKRCPRVTYCVGEIVKDACRCCNVCSSDTGHQHTRYVPQVRADACARVVCPKTKICLVNLQGLPLCSCPRIRSCRKRRRYVCGSDKKTYRSRCHMRVLACQSGKRVRLAYRGHCDGGGGKRRNAVIHKPIVRIKTTKRSRYGAKYNATSRAQTSTRLQLQGKSATFKKREHAQRTRKLRKKRLRKKMRAKKRRRRYRSRVIKKRSKRRLRARYLAY